MAEKTDDLIKMTDEAPLYQLICLSQNGEINPTEVRRLAFEIKGWDRFLQKIEFHRLLPRFFFLLKSAGARDFLQTEIWEKIEARHRMSQFKVLMLEAELIRRLLPRFRQAGIEVLLLKGAALQQTVYRDRPIRSFVDLDLMIHAKDLRQATKVLEEAGYLRRLSHFPSRWHVNQFGLEAGEIAFPFLHSQKQLKLDLHTEAFESWSGFHFKKGWLWEKAGTIPIGQSSARIPEPSRLFLHLLFHLLKHVQIHENILGWYLDLDESLRYFGKEIDGGFCLAAIREGGETGDISEIITFLERELKTPLPLELKPLAKEISTLHWSGFPNPVRPSELVLFNPQLFLSYWGKLSGFQKKVIFLLRWLVPDSEYLRAKYPFRNPLQQILAYGRHWLMMGVKGLSLGLYWLRREKARINLVSRI